ncbi:MAG: transposase, partial [Anaerolineae bacterium]
MEAYDPLIDRLERELEDTAKCHDAYAFQLLRTIPGVGAILGMTFLYEIHDINRFPTVQKFCSYARLIGGTHESAGKPAGSGGKKIGNVHLKWAFGEAASLMIANHPPAKRYRDRLARKQGKAKAMAILAHRLGRIVYYILKRRRPFDPSRFAAAA